MATRPTYWKKSRGLHNLRDLKAMKVIPVLNYRRPAIIGLLALVVLFGGGIAWANFAQISGAVIATGSVVVEGKPKSVQHLDGGIVKAIHVSNGDLVKSSEILVEIDDTSIAANLAIYKSRLRDTLIRKARLLAELNDEVGFEPPTEIAQLLNLGDLKSSIKQQLALQNARRLTRQSQLAQLDEKVSQFENQILGVEGLTVEKKIQIETYNEEISAIEKLVAKKLTSKSRLISLQRAKAELRGQMAENKAEISRVRNSISETRIAKLQVDREFREKVVAEAEQTETKIDELRQQVEATSKQLSRVSIRAPISGKVHELNIFTIGGVVQPGQTLMQIIPQTGNFEIELSVDVSSVDQLFYGQKAVVRFPAFHQRTTPQLDGKVSKISPTSVVDEKTGQAFYRIVVEIPSDVLVLLGDKKLVPGMPVEAFIATEQRTVLSYLVKPLMDQFYYVFREE